MTIAILIINLLVDLLSINLFEYPEKYPVVYIAWGERDILEFLVEPGNNNSNFIRTIIYNNYGINRVKKQQ